MSVTLGKERRATQVVKEPIRSPGGFPLSVTATPKDLTPHSPYFSEVAVALAPALDALGGHGDGHVLRTLIIGMQIGGLLDLGPLAASDLFYALLLKDIGVPGARAQRFHSYGDLDEDAARVLAHADLTDLSQTAPLTAAILKSSAPLGRRLRNVSDLILGSRRQPAAVARAASRLAAGLALEMGFSHGTAAALRSQGERWDGRGRPDGLSGDAIPAAARIIAVAEELDTLLSSETPATSIDKLELEAGRRFDPVLVKLAERLVIRGRLLDQLADDDLEKQALDQEPVERRHVALAGRVDRLLAGMGRLIDSRSSWRVHHTDRVKQLALGAALMLPAPYRLSVNGRRRLARAAMLHDVGKIATPVALHDKPRTLTNEQLDQLRGDARLADRIMLRVLDLAESALVTETFVMAELRAHDDAHAVHMDAVMEGHIMTALVCLSDRFEALLAPRPQRSGKSPAEALAILREELHDCLHVGSEREPVTSYEGVNPGELALRALAEYVSSPSAAHLLTPRKFDADTLVVVD